MAKPKFGFREIFVFLPCSICFRVWAMWSIKLIIFTLILRNNTVGIFRTMVKIRGTGPKSKTRRGFRISSPPIETLYIFMIACLEVYQNNHLSNLFLSKNCSLGENPILNEFLPSWIADKKWNCLGVSNLLQDGDLNPSCPLRINCLKILPEQILLAEWHLFSLFLVSMNLLSLNNDSSFTFETGHVELIFWKKEFWIRKELTEYWQPVSIFPSFFK